MINGLSLNVSKCSKISFLRNKNKIPFVYSIGNNQLPVLVTIRDLLSQTSQTFFFQLILSKYA